MKLKKRTIITIVCLTALGLTIFGVFFYFLSNRQDNINYDCSDFATQQAAQKYFVSQGGSSKKNIDNLDADHDGKACESNSTNAGFNFLKNVDPNSLKGPGPTFEDLANGKAYTNPLCLDVNGKISLDKVIQFNGGCFSYNPY